MKNILFLVAMVAGASIIFNSCKKDEGDSGTNATNILGTWTASDIIIDGQSFWPLMEACSKDDKIIFQSGGSAVFDEGATKCDPNDPQTETTSWKFIDNDTKLVLDGDTGTIILLNSNSLKLGFDDGGTSGEVHYKK